MIRFLCGEQVIVHEFHISKISFGNLDTETIQSLFRDGRVAAPFLEEHIPLWFNGLRRVYGNQDHDHIDGNSVKYDAKNFTARGLSFCPSSQIGVGRRLDRARAIESAQKLVYILCDIVQFPYLRIRFIEGEKLLQLYPKFKIPFRDREKVFGNSVWVDLCHNGA